jgi:hypothetical protein
MKAWRGEQQKADDVVHDVAAAQIMISRRLVRSVKAAPARIRSTTVYHGAGS